MKRILLYLLSFLLLIQFVASDVYAAGSTGDNPTSGAVGNQYFSFYYKKNDKGTYDFFAKNLNYCPYQLQVSFPQWRNMDATVQLPLDTIVNARMREMYLFTATPLDGEQFEFKYECSYWMGDPGKVFSQPDYPYILPYRTGLEFKVTQGYNGEYSHKNTHAIDFGMAEGTAVCAAREGVVIKVKEDSNKGGAHKSFADDCNFITIYHEDGTLAEYVHLKLNGSIVSVGDKVQAGQVIGYSGNTGWSTNAHLHFCVKKPVAMGYATVPVKFYTGKSREVTLAQSESYRSVQPNKTDHVAGNHRRKINLFSWLFSSGHSLF